MQNLNEVSARYTELPNEFYIPEEWRPQDTKNKQGSIIQVGWNPEIIKRDAVVADAGIADGSFYLDDIPSDATQRLKEHCRDSYQLYQDYINAGISREMARMVLPVNIYTEIYACWDLKNLLHFITLRDDGHAQAEIQVYGKAIKQLLESLFPWTMEAYEKYKWTIIES